MASGAESGVRGSGDAPSDARSPALTWACGRRRGRGTEAALRGVAGVDADVAGRFEVARRSSRAKERLLPSERVLPPVAVARGAGVEAHDDVLAPRPSSARSRIPLSDVAVDSPKPELAKADCPAGAERNDATLARDAAFDASLALDHELLVLVRRCIAAAAPVHAVGGRDASRRGRSAPNSSGAPSSSSS